MSTPQVKGVEFLIKTSSLFVTVCHMRTGVPFLKTMSPCHMNRAFQDYDLYLIHYDYFELVRLQDNSLCILSSLITVEYIGFRTGTGIPTVMGIMGTTGMGTVLEFGTLWHTVYPYHGITGISQVCYNRVSINFNVLKLVFSYLIIVFTSEVIVSHRDVTKYGTASHACILGSYHPLFTPTPIPHQQSKSWSPIQN